jgi:hypothetical protein
MRTLRRLAVSSFGLLALVACDRDALYEQNTFSQNVYEAYDECDDAEIRFLSAKHNIQTAFDNCGSNGFAHFAWAPDGVQLYFQLPAAAHIMNAQEKTIGTMPLTSPVGAVAWLSRELLVLPLAPEKDAKEHRLVLFDRVQATMNTIKIPMSEPDDLMPAGKLDQVYFTALDENGERRAYLANFTTSEVTRAFPWLTEPIGSFTYAAAQDLVTWGAPVVLKDKDGKQADPKTFSVKIAKGATGELVHSFEDAHRAVVHAKGRYIALESLGEPISPFDQRAWDELSPEAREREQRRTEEWLSKQPDWVIKYVRPPVIDIYDNETKERYRFVGFYGDKFQWYAAVDFYASFVLWGMEGKQLNKNVALTDLFERLRMAAKGEIGYGVARWLPFDQRGDTKTGEAPAAQEAPVEPAAAPPADASAAPAVPPAVEAPGVEAQK